MARVAGSIRLSPHALLSPDGVLSVGCFQSFPEVGLGPLPALVPLPQHGGQGGWFSEGIK